MNNIDAILNFINDLSVEQAGVLFSSIFKDKKTRLSAMQSLLALRKDLVTELNGVQYLINLSVEIENRNK